MPSNLEELRQSSHPHLDAQRVQRAIERPRRASRLITCLLALTASLLASNVVLTGLLLSGEQPGSGAITAEMSAETVANRFYASVNTAILTGDFAPLTAIVAPEFVQYSAHGEAPSSRAEFLTGLTRLRMVAPNLQLVIDAVSPPSTLGEVTVRLSVFGSDTSAFLGLVPPAEVKGWGWGPRETLRVRDGLVVTRWGAEGSEARLEPLARAELPPVASPYSVVGLVRLTFAPQGTVTLDNGDAARLLVVEAGTLVLARMPASSEPPAILASGDERLTLPREGYVLTNSGEGTLSLLVAVQAPVPGKPDPTGIVVPTAHLAPITSSDAATGVEEHQLAITIVQRVGREAFSLGRVTLAPDMTLTWPVATHPVLIALDRGQLAVATAPPVSGARTAAADAETLLEPGDATLVSEGTATIWRATAEVPAVALVLTLKVGEVPNFQSTPATS